MVFRYCEQKWLLMKTFVKINFLEKIDKDRNIFSHNGVVKHSIWTSAISLKMVAIEYMWNREDCDGHWIWKELMLNIVSLTRTEFYFFREVWVRISLYFETGFVVALVQDNFKFSIIWPLPPECRITSMYYDTGVVFISLPFYLVF